MTRARQLAVVVMGDVDRSPRMRNHALSAAENLESNWSIDLIGYEGQALPEAVRKNKRIQPRYIGMGCVKCLQKLPRICFLLYGILRVIIQSLQLFWMLLLTKRYDVILIQNPPCIPLLFVCVVVRIMRCFNTKLIILNALPNNYIPLFYNEGL